jgi:hypothetical protein
MANSQLTSSQAITSPIGLVILLHVILVLIRNVGLILAYLVPPRMYPACAERKSEELVHVVEVLASHRSTLARKRGAIAEPRIHASNSSRDRATSSRTSRTGLYKHTMIFQRGESLKSNRIRFKIKKQEHQHGRKRKPRRWRSNEDESFTVRHSFPHYTSAARRC